MQSVGDYIDEFRTELETELKKIDPESAVDIGVPMDWCIYFKSERYSFCFDCSLDSILDSLIT